MPSHLERQIERLKSEVMRLGTLAEESVQKSLRAMENRDTALAEQVIAEDRWIDELGGRMSQVARTLPAYGD